MWIRSFEECMMLNALLCCQCWQMSQSFLSMKMLLFLLPFSFFFYRCGLGITSLRSHTATSARHFRVLLYCHHYLIHSVMHTSRFVAVHFVACRQLDKIAIFYAWLFKHKHARHLRGMAEIENCARLLFLSHHCGTCNAIQQLWCRKTILLGLLPWNASWEIVALQAYVWSLPNLLKGRTNLPSQCRISLYRYNVESASTSG